MRPSNDFHPLARAGSPHSLYGGELEDGEGEEEEEEEELEEEEEDGDGDGEGEGEGEGEEQIRVANLPVIMAPAFVYLGVVK